MKLIYTMLLAVMLPAFAHSQIVFQISSTAVSCFGGDNGTAHATASGGTAPYTYAWSTGEQGESISGLQAGIYTVTATDNVGLTAAKSVSVIQPPPVGVTLNGQPQICEIAPDGFVYAIPLGGTPPFTYSWNNGTSIQLNDYLTAGSYTVTVSDIKGCTATKSYEVPLLGTGLYLFSTAEKAHCPLGNDGQASVTVASGTAPYTFSWNNGGATDTIYNLVSGLYQVTVTDMNGCSAVSTSSVGLAPMSADTVNVQGVQCLDTAYSFTADPAFSAFNWVLDNPADSIIAQESDQVTIMWREEGVKHFHVEMSNTSSNCFSAIYYRVQASQCHVGSTEPSRLEMVVASPNPFTDFIDIQGVTDETTCSLFALDGALIRQEVCNASHRHMETGHLPAGVYVLRLSSAAESRTLKLLHE